MEKRERIADMFLEQHGIGMEITYYGFMQPSHWYTVRLYELSHPEQKDIGYIPYHCGAACGEPGNSDILYCLAVDCGIYEDFKHLDKYQALNAFADEFGYTKVGDAIQVWEALEEQHNMLFSYLHNDGMAALIALREELDQ
jgi:hypothetical protein